MERHDSAEITRKGFTLKEFVTSCSTCMGKEGLINDVTREEAETKDED